MHGVYKNQFSDNDWIAVYVCVDAHMVMERKSANIHVVFSASLGMLCIFDDQKMQCRENEMDEKESSELKEERKNFLSDIDGSHHKN